MISYDEFLATYYPAANAFREKDVKRFLDNLNEIIGTTPLTVALTNKQVLCSAFFLQENGCGISRPHYQKIKEYLVNLFEMCGVEGNVPTREEVVASQQNIGYFRGINELMQFIDNVGIARMDNYNPSTDLVIIKGICVFGWLGFSPAEIADLKKSDLTMVDLKTYRVSHGQDTFEITGEPFAALYYLSNLETYKGFPSGRAQTLKGDPSHLFRPSTNLEAYTGNSIIQSIKRFNAHIPAGCAQKAILFRNLHKNELFIEVYQDTTNESLIAKIMRIMQCDSHYALSYREQYLQFVSALEKNII